MHLVRGPLFSAALVFMVLGLFRVFFLQLIEIGRAWGSSRREGSREEFKQFLLFVWRASPPMELKSWLIAMSFSFYFLSVFIAAFLLDHVRILRYGTGIELAGISKGAMDYIALLAVSLGAALLLIRTIDPAARRATTGSDYLLMGLIMVIILTGLTAAHPSWLFLPYSSNMIVHMLAAEAMFVSIPFSRLAREVLYPVSRLGSGLLLNPSAEAVS